MHKGWQVCDNSWILITPHKNYPWICFYSIWCVHCTWMKTCIPKTSTSYLISISPAMLVATQTYRPESEGSALTISILRPCSRIRRFPPAFTGDPSFSQVSEGGGWPAASHSSTRVLSTTTFFSTGPSTPPAMEGGTGGDKYPKGNL